MNTETLLRAHRIEINDGTWLHWDEDSSEWVLREQFYRARTSHIKAVYPKLEDALLAIDERKKKEAQ